ncbi:MAG TPA: hypothetical protein PLA50_09075 [Bacteroidia bacterium]|nr:hypothetical protein [Bacteroidia bacterium]
MAFLLRWFLIGAALSWAWRGSVLSADGDADPASIWLAAYAWMQTGDQLAEGGQWPLALGSYFEARRQIEALAAQHRGFEVEMVLERVIHETELRLTDDEHGLTMRYLDFIESLELGLAQRYQNKFEDAYASLGMAKSLLDEIVESKPAEFREAVAPQYQRLESSLQWLDSQINFTAVSSRPAAGFGGSAALGTTRFVKEKDLPVAVDAPLGPSALFPGLPAEAATAVPPADPGVAVAPPPKKEEEQKQERDSSGTTMRRFRMSSGQGQPPTDASAKP